ncbi:MAG: hypothetical protein JO080_13265 [Mucilaginibacter sp.]|nr:hypothetical protein [Mucilaginibacter sp.]
MLMLLIQIIGVVATAIIAIILLKKDWRTKNEAIRKEAVLVTKIIFAITIVSVLNLAISHFQSQSDINKLEKDKRQLQVTNANLSFDISKSAPAEPVSPDKKRHPKPPSTIKPEPQQHLLPAKKGQPEHLVTSKPSQKKVPKKYSLTENKDFKKRLIPVSIVKPVAAETKAIPLFHFINTGGKSLAGVLIYKNSKPVYNLSVSITNYDNLMNCKTTNDNAFDSKCFIKNTYSSPTIAALNAQSNYFIKLPQFKRRANSGRYVIMLRVNNRTYSEEAIYTFSTHNHFSQALRIKEYDDGVLVHAAVIKDDSHRLKSIDWKRRFPLSLNEQSRKGYIVAN